MYPGYTAQLLIFYIHKVDKIKTLLTAVFHFVIQINLLSYVLIRVDQFKSVSIRIPCATSVYVRREDVPCCITPIFLRLTNQNVLSFQPGLSAVSLALPARPDRVKLVTGGPRQNVVSELLKMREHACITYLTAEQ